MQTPRPVSMLEGTLQPPAILCPQKKRCAVWRTLQAWPHTLQLVLRHRTEYNTTAWVMTTRGDHSRELGLSLSTTRLPFSRCPAVCA